MGLVSLAPGTKGISWCWGLKRRAGRWRDQIPADNFLSYLGGTGSKTKALPRTEDQILLLQTNISLHMAGEIIRRQDWNPVGMTLLFSYLDHIARWSVGTKNALV